MGLPKDIEISPFLKKKIKILPSFLYFMDNNNVFTRVNHFAIKNFTLIIILNLIIRFGFIIIYYISPFGLYDRLGDISLNWNDANSLETLNLSSYPFLSLILLYFFKLISFGNIKIFMIWAGILEIILVLFIWYGMKILNQNKSKKEDNNLLFKDESQYKWALILFLYNPFWFLHNVFGWDVVGYHFTDYFFLFVFFAVIFFYERDQKILSYIFLGLSAGLKWFTLPALVLYGLQLIAKKNWKELKRYLLFAVGIALLTLLLPFIFINNALSLYISWLNLNRVSLFGYYIPFYIKIIPLIIVLFLYFWKIFKNQTYLSALAWSLIIFLSFAFWTRTYLRYLLGLIICGHLYYSLVNKKYKIPYINIKLDQHELTFWISFIGAGFSILFIFIGLA